VGEQSNAYRILLRYDRKSRHRRIKKQRRYERLAATSQFRPTHGAPQTRRSAASPPRAGRVDGRALSGGRSPYLRPPRGGPTPLRALDRPAVAGSRIGCGSPLSLGFLPVRPERTPLGGATARAWYRGPHEGSPHPGVSPHGRLPAPWSAASTTRRGPD
jgi:hypothetical protein